MDNKGSNPLSKHFRQPAIYLKLPSNGEFWPEDAIKMPINGEIAVYPMTTSDEITLRTPDALMNGAGVVSVIKSCCPEIIDPWRMPSIDVDAVIIGIRIASYGAKMEFNSQCPHCNSTHDYALDLQETLARIKMPNYDEPVESDNLKIKLCPQTYFELNQANILRFEEEKLTEAIQATEMSVEQRAVVINKQVQKILDIGLQGLTASTQYIEISDGTRVGEKEYIMEFYKNTTGHLIKLLQVKLTEISEVAAIKPMKVNCVDCTKEFEIQVTFDYASFFESGF